MIKSMVAGLILGIATVGTTATGALSVPVTEPFFGLNPGDQYRLAFVTSTTRDATSSDISDYNSFVAGVANGVPELAALGTSWLAIASTSSVDARDNTGTNPSATGVPIFLLDGFTQFAQDNADLWNGVESFINLLRFDENGDLLTAGGSFSNLVWTGSNSVGTAFAPLGGPFNNFGSALLTGGNWIDFGRTSPIREFRMYAISGIIDFQPIVEPAPISILGLGLIGLAMMRRKRVA